MAVTTLNGSIYAGMILAGSANLSRHVEEVNDLNVFPIPDGDTGENMMLTMRGGANAADREERNLSAVADKIARGMLLGARGNSGVILSQFFAGIAEGFHTYENADIRALEKAVACGVGCAYEAVMTPTPGTILTVVKDACRYAGETESETIEDYFAAFLEEARRSLDRTPELLPVLKEAGVVDSGGMGLIYIVEGMYAYLSGREIGELRELGGAVAHAVDPDLFTEDSVMEFGYCTELLLRLQTCKTDPERFDVSVITDYLCSIGDSVVTVKTDSIVKLHVHTMTPYRVLEFCQQYGEFLTIKIENMMLQHNETVEKAEKTAKPDNSVPANASEVRERKPFGVVTVATGDGIRAAFSEMGADEVICGGQTMNPSAEDFLGAFDRVNADTIFVLPNNGNILLAARQAAQIWKSSDIRVIPTRTIGEGYAVLSMLDLDSGDADLIEADMKSAMSDVLTAEVSQSIRDASMNGVEVKKGDYIAILGKTILAAGASREEIATAAAKALQIDDHPLVLIIRGKGVEEAEAMRVGRAIQAKYPMAELCHADGGQDIYDYILVAE